ncbi:MAG: tetratricopeptide repeat protein [Thermogutta sp.]
MVRRACVYLWPGTAPLLVRPTIVGWLGSAAMAVVFHLALAATILWPEWLSPVERGLLWAALGVAWLSGVAWSYELVRGRSKRDPRDTSPDSFPQAMHAYLAGNLAHAESLVRAILRKSPRDVEAALLLATIWRRRGQLDAAEKLLRNLARLEMAQPWLWEIQRELMRVGESREEQPPEVESTQEDKKHVGGEPAVQYSSQTSWAKACPSNSVQTICRESEPASKAA